jgi:hypothetical protein
MVNSPSAGSPRCPSSGARSSGLLGAFAGLALALAWGPAPRALAAPPAVQRAEDAVRLLGAEGPALLEGVTAVKEACRGRLRHELRDHPRLFAAVTRVVEGGGVEAKKAVLELVRCFSGPRLEPLFSRALRDEAPAVVAFAAEVAARTGEWRLVPTLLEVAEVRRAGCLAGELAPSEAEVCVWLTYAPGALLEAADRPTREQAAAMAATMLEAATPKVREVAVETLRSSRLARGAKLVRALVEKEERGAFAVRNDAALLARFRERAQTLAKTGEE